MHIDLNNKHESVNRLIKSLDNFKILIIRGLEEPTLQCKTIKGIIARLCICQSFSLE